MRVLRKIFGIVGVVVGLPLLIAGATAWLAIGHRDGDGAFAAELAPVHTSGYAVVVPDVAELLAQHGAAKWLRPGRLRVTVAPQPRPVLAMIMPAEVARGYLDGVPRTEVAAVGFATGAQPVRLADVDGSATPAPGPELRALASGADVVWDPATATGPLSLVVMRTDGEPDLDVTLTVGIRSSWLDPAARSLLLGGATMLLAGCAALLWRTREPRSDARLPVPRTRREVATNVDSYPADEGERMAHNDTDDGAVIDLDEERDERGGRVRAAAARALRWGEGLRTRSRTNSTGRHAYGAPAFGVDVEPVDRQAEADDAQRRLDLPNGESPYIYTAT